MPGDTAHIDTFARDHLPPPEQWPVFNLDLPRYAYPERLNTATELLDRMVADGFGERAVIHSQDVTWNYRELQAWANRIARVLTEDLGLVSGNRVLLRAANNPMMVACWYAVAKAGGIVVATMPLLRARELATIVDKAQVRLALCDARLSEEMEACANATHVLERICYFDGAGMANSDSEMVRLASDKPDDFVNIDTAADDVVLIAFTSGTTGRPKGTVHFHRDLLAIADCFPREVLHPTPEDVFIGSPPLAFTFGLGGLVTFPMRFGASTVLLETPTPENLLRAIQEFNATICFTAPTAYRAMGRMISDAGPGAVDLSRLRLCVSAGETLPLATFDAWHKATGIRIVDGIGATELLHIFISAPEDAIRPGATGKPLPGYEAMVVDEAMSPLPAGEVGRLAVRGPTGCRYLDDPRQQEYVVQGWNLTGDAYRMDEDGYFWFEARADDMIITAGYNIAGPEVEDALMAHTAVAECAVVGAPDTERGQIVKAFVVATETADPTTDLIKELQEFVKSRIAPYKYPRVIEFVTALPKTETGKIQRYKLRA